MHFGTLTDGHINTDAQTNQPKHIFVPLVAHSRLIPYFLSLSHARFQFCPWLGFFSFFFFFFFFSFFSIITPYSFFVRTGDIPSSARRQICLCILRRKLKDYNNNKHMHRLAQKSRYAIKHTCARPPTRIYKYRHTRTNTQTKKKKAGRHKDVCASPLHTVHSEWMWQTA